MPSPRSSSGRWGVIAIFLVAIVGFGVLYWQRHEANKRAHRQGANLTGPAATLDLGNGVTLELVRISPGSFQMGSPDSEPDRDVSEGPQHAVRIKKPFYIGKFEVTQAQWKVIRQPQSHSNVGDNFPADGTSWNDASKWCEEMSKRLGVTMRLPTEAEWEYACRAGTSTPFAFGATLTADQANFSTGDASAKGKTWAVGSGKPNAWGLYDMHGNVWEWCLDTLQPDYEGAPADGSAWVVADNKYNHVRRGGSWHEKPAECRSAVRWGSGSSEQDPDLRNDQVGFRVVVEVPAGKKGDKTDAAADPGTSTKRKRKRAATTNATTGPSTTQSVVK